MLVKNRACKFRKVAFEAIILTLFLSFWHGNVNDNKSVSSNDDFELKGAVFAGNSTNVFIKVDLLFEADIDGSKQVDGRDLALFMYYFGKTESEYKIDNLKVNPDINRDKIVDGEDLVILASHFGLKR
jgi:hypothetical protein